MIRYCKVQFVEAIKILKPTILIFQYAGYARKFLQTMKALGNNPVSLSQTNPDIHLYTYHDNIAGDVFVCDFYHPSAWGNNSWQSREYDYYQKVVKPTIEKVRQYIGLLEAF